jgi:hypothetical protein
VTFDYQKSANTALALIAKFGRTIQHVEVTEGAYDTTTSALTTTETTTDVIGCDFAMKDNAYTSGLVQTGDRYCLIGQSVSDINVSDRLIIDGITWHIINVQKLAPAAIVVLWRVHIRK